MSDATPIARPGLLLLILAALTGTAKCPDLAWAAKGPGPSSYKVTLLRLAPPRFAVRARLPIDGVELDLDTTRPAGIPELDAGGWSALVTNLRVTDSAGRALSVAGAAAAGWRLEQPHHGRLIVDYEIDYALLAAHGWPASLESGLADSSHIVLAGRSMFLTTRTAGPREVVFDLPRGWRAVTPWGAAAKSAEDLVGNLLVLSRSAPDQVTAGGFRLLVVPMGHWEPARDEVRGVLNAVVPRLVSLIGSAEGGDYLIVLLPTVDQGGESFRNSFAITVETQPSRATRSVWGNTLAHEIFHYWNGWRLAGSDYAATQWFQEGFTEYAANVSLVGGGAIGPDDFLRKLSQHVANYRKLTTTLEAPGSRKGPPLYGGGALVAFSWDVWIRQATGGERDLGDFFQALWRQTEQGRRPYGWGEIRAALENTATRDWEAYFLAHVRGKEPLPLAEVLALAGLRLDEADGVARITEDPAAPASARSLWRTVIEGR